MHGPAWLGPGAARLARHWPLLPAVAVAAALRLASLFPNFYHGDEAEYVTVASYLADDPRDLAYPRIEGFASVPFVSQPPLVLYLFALSIKAWGLDGPLLASALLGTATVAVTYALGVRLRDRWLGAMAALFLAVLPAHVGVSRAAQLDAGLTFFVALAALAFLHWVARPTWARALVAGLALAAAALAKLPGVLVLLPVAAVLVAQALGHALAARRGRDPAAQGAGREALRELGANAGIAAVPVLLAGAMYVGYLWSMGATQDLLDKLGWQAARVSGGVIGATAGRPWHWYFTEPELGLMPQLGLVLTLFALAGAAMVARALATDRPDRAGRLFLLAWPLAMLLFFMASDRKEWFYLMPAMPAVTLLAAWPLQPAARAVSSYFADPRKRWDPRPAVAIVAVLVVTAVAVPASASVNVRILQEGRYGQGLKEAAEWIGESDPGAGQVGTLLSRFTLHLYNGHDTLHYYVNHTYVEQRIAQGEVRYVVLDTYLNLTFEQQWLAHLVAGHGGELVHSIPTAYTEPVRVYRLNPGP